MIIRSVIIMALIGCLFVPLFGQKEEKTEPELPRNSTVEELLKQGKFYLKQENFLNAANTFEIASEYPINQSTTTCLYLAGISWFHLEEGDKAKVHFNKIITYYPRSEYLYKAKYHKAILLMNAEEQPMRELGLDIMLYLSEKSKDKKIRENSIQTARHYLFNVYDRGFLEIYERFVAPTYGSLVIEALCYKLDQEGKQDAALEKIDEYLEEHGRLTRYLKMLRTRIEHPEAQIRDELRMAIMLPFMLETIDSNSVIPKKSKRAVELFQGMQIAIDSLQQKLPQKVIIEVFDTQKDTIILSDQFDDLERFDPDIVIGDITTTTSNYLAEWCEENLITHLIPLNPSDILIEDREYVFLTHPSQSTHGEKMADYLFNQKAFRKVAVVHDPSMTSTLMSKAFIDRFDTLGGEVIVKKIATVSNEESLKLIKNTIKELESESFEAIYLPVTNEENGGYFLSRMTQSTEILEMSVFGSPDWDYFDAIDEEQKVKYDLSYSTIYYDKNDSAAFESFRNRFIMAQNNYPTRYVVMGYDIMQFILRANMKREPFQGLADLLREAEIYKGLHQNMGYYGRQDNQEVTIVKYDYGRITKVLEQEE